MEKVLLLLCVVFKKEMDEKHALWILGLEITGCDSGGSMAPNSVTKICILFESG